jgi:hypothetical protein
VHLGTNPLHAGPAPAAGDALGAPLPPSAGPDALADDDPAGADVGLEMH